MRWVIEAELLLEGFRKGRIVRLFVHPAWPINDMPFGEGLYTERPNVKFGEEPEQYPYRTDFANADLPWYHLKPGVYPPLQSHHLISGELLKVDAVHRTGEFRADRTGDLIRFTMPPYGSIQYLGAAADLAELPLGARYDFFLYQDDRGAFSQAVVIMDHFSRLVRDTLTYRVEGVQLGEGKIFLASQLAHIKNDKDDLFRPPDVARGEFAIDGQTRVWKGDTQLAIADVAVGDELLVNLTGETPTARSRCTDIWVGVETQARATAQQRSKYDASIKARGFAGWVEKVQGKELTITFFTGPGNDFQTRFHDGPPDRNVFVTPVDDELVPQGTAAGAMKFKESQLEGAHPGTYGCRGTRWVIEAEQPTGGYDVGQVVRVFADGPPAK